MTGTRKLLTIKQVAEFRQVSTDTIDPPAKSGEFRGRKIGRIWQFPKDAIQCFVQRQAAVTSLSQAKHVDVDLG